MIKVALPNKGVLFQPTLDLLASCGYRVGKSGSQLSSFDPENDVEFYFLRPGDIPVYVANGILDAGITGRDLAAERGHQPELLLDLNYGDSRLCAAVPITSPVHSLDEVSRLRIATSFPNIVYALDLSKEGAPQIWKHVPNQSPDAIPIACCDLVNRGTAYSPSGKIYIQLLQGELLALDAKTGKELWKVKHPDKSSAGTEATGYKQGATMTNAPIYIKTKSGKEIVIAGISGGEFGVRGRVSAFDANTGQHLWTRYSTGPDDEVGIVNGNANANYKSHQGKDLGVSTWQGDEWKRGGGTTWGWYSYDPELDIYYHSVGNPGTWNPDQRPGDNKWSMTIFARKPDNGEVVWAYQMTPHDEWDYDGVNEMILADIKVSLASRAAEELFLGTQLSGVYSDLQHATQMAMAYIGLWGMGGSLVSIAAMGGTPNGALHQQVDRLLKEQYREVKRLLDENREA
ncbi:MAG: ATP phosphoribosyltransferase, partial [Chloroflexota bacterium]